MVRRWNLVTLLFVAGAALKSAHCFSLHSRPIGRGLSTTANVVTHKIQQSTSSPISPRTIASSSPLTLFATSSSGIASASIGTTMVDEVCDVLVLGSGPAARAIASLLSAPQQGSMKVILADQNVDKVWPANYGVWQDEWQSVVDRFQAAGVPFVGGNVDNAIDRAWNVTDCYFGGSFDIPIEEQMRVNRPYYRVDKYALRDSLTGNEYKIVEANHISKAIGPNLYSPAGSLMHDEDGTTIQLRTKEDQFLTVRSKLVVDCTGHETKLVLRETRPESQPPGFQIAYGCLVDVDDSNSPDLSRFGPYDKEAMTLFDYRTDHFLTEEEKIKADRAPTFMYAMPIKDNQVFFEETSLVARPAMSFQECKDRCFQRLDYLGIRVTKVHEEEFCYIPMGGALPAKDQRVLALGGSAAMVHPSTGYHICRCLMGATDMAAAIHKEMSSSPAAPLDRVAASAYDALWSPENIMQRNFAVFGGEFLMKQNVVGLRGFFDGFFRLPTELWGGFLAGWPGLPNNDKHESWIARLWYGVNFIVRIPPLVAVDMLASIATHMVTEGVPLPQSVTPFFGKPESYEYKRNVDGVGDVAAKSEARRMLLESEVEKDVPIAFSSTEDGRILSESKAGILSQSVPQFKSAEVVEAKRKAITDDSRLDETIVEGFQ
jgi:lycopene beta-cyclase